MPSLRYSRGSHVTSPLRFRYAFRPSGHPLAEDAASCPFASIEDHDETLIARWNAVVRLEDTVWHLGDFCYHCGEDHTRSVFDRLRGKTPLPGSRQPRQDRRAATLGRYLRRRPGGPSRSMSWPIKRPEPSGSGGYASHLLEMQDGPTPGSGTSGRPTCSKTPATSGGDGHR